MFHLRSGVVILLCAAGFALPAAKKATKSEGITLQPGTTVEAKAGDKNIPLKPEEKVALAFLEAIKSLEGDCVRHAKHVCTIAELVQGPKSTDNWRISHLKYDPANDPNYKYVVTPAPNNRWTLQVNPQHPGLGGFLVDGTSIFMPDTFYNPKGSATTKDSKITEMGISGEIFNVSQ